MEVRLDRDDVLAHSGAVVKARIDAKIQFQYGLTRTSEFERILCHWALHDELAALALTRNFKPERSQQQNQELMFWEYRKVNQIVSIDLCEPEYLLQQLLAETLPLKFRFHLKRADLQNPGAGVASRCLRMRLILLDDEPSELTLNLDHPTVPGFVAAAGQPSVEGAVILPQTLEGGILRADR